MTHAQQGSTVKVHYTGKLEDGTVFDSSRGRDPLEVTIGEHKVIQGFEDALVGMKEGDTKTARIGPDEGYGQHDDNWVAVIDRAEIPEDLDPKPGDRLQVQQPDGRTLPVWVRAVSESQVKLDANHPLAGRDLIFELEVVEIS